MLNDISTGTPTRVISKITTSDLPGLGIELYFDMLGDIVRSF